MGLTLYIDVAAIVANWRTLAALHANPTAAVLKADGYGLGAAHIAPALLAAGATEFFVATPAEGVALRAAIPHARLYVLGGLWPDQTATYLAHTLIPVLGSAAETRHWMETARTQQKPLAAAIHIDTGMRRLGLDGAELTALAADPAPFSALNIHYVMTHLVAADTPAAPENAAQLAAFTAARKTLPPVPASLANSSGIFLGTGFRTDLARPGAALFGINPTPGLPNPMRTVLRLTARVLQIREIATGESVGYNATWRAQRSTRVACVCAGYADGYLRSLSNNGAAIFDGQPLPLIGRVSMDLLTFDATDVPSLRAGDALELIGPAMPPDTVAARAATNGYEILTQLSRRADRVYGAR